MKDTCIKVQVAELISSRYGKSVSERPLSWDKRKAGLDVIRSVDNKVIELWSDGGQSPPQPGWVILVNPGTPNPHLPTKGEPWTLFGIPPK